MHPFSGHLGFSAVSKGHEKAIEFWFNFPGLEESWNFVKSTFQMHAMFILPQIFVPKQKSAVMNYFYDLAMKSSWKSNGIFSLRCKDPGSLMRSKLSCMRGFKKGDLAVFCYNFSQLEAYIGLRGFSCCAWYPQVAE